MRRLLIANIAGFFLFLGLTGLGGCGQIGSLYLPEAEPVSDTNVPAPEQTKPGEKAQTEQSSN